MLATDTGARMKLSYEELVSISGYKRPRDQAACVRDRYGIPAYVNAANEAIVIRAHLESANTIPQNGKRVRTVRAAA